MNSKLQIIWDQIQSSLVINSIQYGNAQHYLYDNDKCLFLSLYLQLRSIYNYLTVVNYINWFVKTLLV